MGSPRTRAVTAAVIAFMLAALVVYAVLIGLQSVTFLRSGSVVGTLLGLAVLVVPLLGLGLSVRELRFGQQCARLVAELDAEQGLPVDDLPRRPSGRVDRGAADAHFQRMRTETEEAPEDWRRWLRLSLAYDDAGDRTRARSAARHAIELHR